MVSGGDSEEIAIGLRISDQALAQRLISFLAGDRHFHLIDSADDHEADVILTDHVHELRGPSIIIDDCPERLDSPGGDIRAMLTPGVNAELLCAAIRVVAAGFFIAERADHPDDSEEVGLTARESEVLHLLAQGASNKAIARELAISVHTAKFHVASLLAKLGAHNRSDAITLGLRRGLLLL